VHLFTNKCCFWRESEKGRKPKACKITKSPLLRMGERPTQKRWLHVNIPQLVIKSVASNKLLSLSLSLVSCINLHPNPEIQKAWSRSTMATASGSSIKFDYGRFYSSSLCIKFIKSHFFFRILSFCFSLILCFCYNLVSFFLFLLGLGWWDNWFSVRLDW